MSLSPISRLVGGRASYVNRPVAERTCVVGHRVTLAVLDARIAPILRPGREEQAFASGQFLNRRASYFIYH